MSCLYPRIRAETHESYINKKGGISYKHELIPVGRTKKEQDKWNLMVGPDKPYRKIQVIGCQKCVECLLNYSRDKATLIMLEKIYHNPNECWFITFTYNDEHLPFQEVLNQETGEIITGASLKYKDFADFMKRLRYYHKEKIKSLYAGEYGSQTVRPHYHAILMGLKLDTSTFKKKGMNEQNDPLWEVPELTKIWGMGHVTVGRVTWNSAAYVARYTLKKAYKKDKTWYKMQGLQPEFIHWGNGWGKQYFEDHFEKIFETDSVPVKGGVKPPIKYDRLLKEIDTDLYDIIKEQRKATAEANAEPKNTDLRLDEYRKMKERKIKSSFKDMRRKEI